MTDPKLHTLRDPEGERLRDAVVEAAMGWWFTGFEPRDHTADLIAFGDALKALRDHLAQAAHEPAPEITLKCWPAEFQAIKRGDKHFEYRKLDRPFEVGSILRLREWHYEYCTYSGDEIRVRVTYILSSGFGLPEGYGVLSIEPVIYPATAPARVEPTVTAITDAYMQFGEAFVNAPMKRAFTRRQFADAVDSFSPTQPAPVQQALTGEQIDELLSGMSIDQIDTVWDRCGGYRDRAFFDPDGAPAEVIVTSAMKDAGKVFNRHGTLVVGGETAAEIYRAMAVLAPQPATPNTSTANGLEQENASQPAGVQHSPKINLSDETLSKLYAIAQTERLEQFRNDARDIIGRMQG